MGCAETAWYKNLVEWPIPPQITRWDAISGEVQMDAKTCSAVGRIAEPHRTIVRDVEGFRERRESSRL